MLTRSDEECVENCATIFNRIISCVMEIKSKFCRTVSLEFFLLDSTDEANYLAKDNLFSMRDVQRILASPQGKQIVISAKGQGRMKLSKVRDFLKLTYWHILFPISLTSVIHHLESVGSNLYMFGLHLCVSEGFVRALEPGFVLDMVESRRKLVSEWMRSSIEPPCWSHLVQALHRIEMGTLAEKLTKQFGTFAIVCKVCKY